MSSSLLLQQCHVCPVRLTWIVFVMGCKWPYSWCLVGCCRPELHKNVASNTEQDDEVVTQNILSSLVQGIVIKD